MVISSSRTTYVEHKFESVNTVRDRKVSSKGSCYRCSRNHISSKLKFIDKECFYCKKKGQTIKVYRKRKDFLSRNVTSNLTYQFIDMYSDDENVSEDDILTFIIMEIYERIKSRHTNFMHSLIFVQ